jgi:hypothetical protein
MVEPLRRCNAAGDISRTLFPQTSQIAGAVQERLPTIAPAQSTRRKENGMTDMGMNEFGLDLGIEPLDELVDPQLLEFVVGVVVGAAAAYGALALGIALAT